MGNSKVRSYIFLGTIFVVIAIVAIFNLMNNGELFWQATFYLFFASTFWTKLQNIFGHCCMSKLDKVAKRWPVMIRPAI